MAVKKVADFLSDYSPRVTRKVYPVEWAVVGAVALILALAAVLGFGALPLPSMAGRGVAPLKPGKLSKGITRRIEKLGKMNDRRSAYLGARDWLALLELAEEYAAMKMPLMAAEIRKEVANANVLT